MSYTAVPPVDDDNIGDIELNRNGRDWRRLWTSANSHNSIGRLVSYATGFLILLITLTWFLYPWEGSAPLPTDPPASRNSIKFMVIGDSISQGWEGDYTWRYRLWQWLREADREDVSFVGPYVGTFPPPDLLRPPGWRPPSVWPALETRDWAGYNMGVEMAWLEGGHNAHFAHWGRNAGQYQSSIEEAVGEAQPDYVLLALGFNDLAWIRNSTQLLDVMADLVASCRAARPDIKFAIANVIQRSAAGGKPELPLEIRMYNAMLEEMIPKWGRHESPVELVRMRESYECDPWSCPASHDGIHPNARGEYQIARAFVRTLNGRYGLGSPSFSIPAHIPDRSCPPPKNIKAVAMRHDTLPTAFTIQIAWDSVYGAYDYWVQAQRKGGNWAVMPYNTDHHSFNHTNLGPGEEWQLRVRADCGSQQPNSNWSSVIFGST